MFPKHFISFTCLFFFKLSLLPIPILECISEFIYRPKKLIFGLFMIEKLVLKEVFENKLPIDEAFSEQVIHLNWCLNVTFWAAASESEKKALDWAGHLSSVQALLPQSRVAHITSESLYLRRGIMLGMARVSST